LEKGVEGEIASFENECAIDVDWASSDDILQPAHYVEHWRLVLWDKAFRVYFDKKGDFKFTKGINLMEFEEGPIAIKRVAYRYYFLFPICSSYIHFFLVPFHFLHIPFHFRFLIFFFSHVHSP
jgi:hypothetical protein